jgi:hypothetical protein
MSRYLVLTLITGLLVVACGGTSAPSEPQTVTLVALQGGSNVTLINDPQALFPEDVGLVPTGTECVVVDKWSSRSGHGGETILFYKVDCSGLVGWVRDWVVTFSSAESSP